MRSMGWVRVWAFILIGGLAVVSGQVVTQATSGRESKPRPDVEDASYGPHERNVLDLWLARSETPAPLVVFIHGGGFRSGSKANVEAAFVNACLKAGISVASISYRLSQQAPFPAPMLDGARAIQFLRSKASAWNIDPDRIAAAGSSAGAGIALWVGFHDDMAEKESDDPVARQSTRLACAAVIGAQSSYDPRFIKAHIGGRAHEHPALLPFYGLRPDELDSARAHALYEQASPINAVSPGDPPVFLSYSEPNTPLPPSAKPGEGIHHPRFGTLLKERLDPLGIRCEIRHRDDYRGRADAAEALNSDMVRFLARHLGAKAADGAKSVP